ncbi:uncharacterized protein LOC129323215 [Prosopis cineraria]|uniref:uncharacterized protein LOC129323215 n=1 Tax=Prosopis cineraria TaxID=364024 RepID=UPI00240EC3C7|nr:uncharacterized protein LOC129323215 [Prosopis cineraria]
MLKALEREPYITEEVSIAAKKQLQIKRCKHGGGNDLFQCFKSIIEKEPSKSFLVASPCEELWREFDRAPNMRVPTIYWDGSGADFMLRAPEESSPKKEMKAAGSKLRAPEESSPKKEMKAAGSKLRAPEESSPKKEMKAAGSKRKKGKGEGEGSSKKKIKSTKFSGSG